MSDIPNRFTAEYYGETYFKTPNGKKFRRADGSTESWSYNNPTGEFLGAKDITKAWKTVFKPKTMLSVAEGRGTFVAYARDIQIEAMGFDYSKWAIDEGRYGRCKKEWLIHHDAVTPWPYTNNSFDTVVALDFFEHIYEEDIGFVRNELFRVAKKWIFLQIATPRSGGLDGIDDRFEGYALKKDEPVPIEFEGCAAAGHVTVKPEDWWLDKLETDDWMINRAAVNWFCSLVDPAIIKNWLLNSIIVLEKLE